MPVASLTLCAFELSRAWVVTDLRDLQVQTEVFDPETKECTGYRVEGAGAMRIISNRQTLQTARTAFPYLAKPADYVAPGLLRRRVASFTWEQIPHDEAYLDVCGLPIRCMPLYHGGTYISLGFAFGRGADGHRPFVYLSDVKAVPPATEAWLAEAPINVLVVDLLRRADHTTHFSFDEAVAFVKRVKPRRALFVGMASCEVGDHDEVNEELRQIGADCELDMQLAYDGLCLPPMATLPSDPEEWKPCKPCAPDGY